jgi:Zn-dependent M28 family amino/carboxypeptidase
MLILYQDSTLPAPGAADDALACVLMLDAIRVLLDTPGWSPHYSIIFCKLLFERITSSKY